MNELDLHGIKHEDVDRLVENFVLLNKTPMRIISGRNIEAAGTKTVQILFEGEYGGYFQPDTHYIPLKKDFTNFDEVVDKFSDSSYSSQIATNAYDLVMSELTYDKILNKFYEQVQLIL